MQLRSRPLATKLSPALSRPLMLSFFISLVLFLIAFIYLPKAQPELPMLYTLNAIVGPLRNKWFLLIIPSISLITNMVNFFITLNLKNTFSLLILKLFVFANLVITILLAVAMLRIIYVTW